MDLEERIELICRRPTDEVVTTEELKILLETRQCPVAYDGFEGSGIPHIATGLLKALKVKDITDAGCKHIFFLADWHSVINGKLDGDFSKIRTACNLFIEVWKSLLEAMNVDLGKVEFKFGTQIYDQQYWGKVLQISKGISLGRAKRALTIAGRKEAEVQDLASFFYIPMQVADIFHMNVDICQLGMDQRKANMLAREIGPKIGFWKPTCVHHHLLMSLQGPKRMGFEEDEGIDRQVSSKMSKSSPETCIYVTDTPKEIETKINTAFCPPKDIRNNPVIELCRYLVLRGGLGDFLEVDRPRKFGGPVTFWRIEDLEETYQNGELHPLDLKHAISAKIADLLEPCRDHFKNDKRANELLQITKGFDITR